jgi:putative spermidine/putrescine transport system permease protein
MSDRASAAKLGQWVWAVAVFAYLILPTLIVALMSIGKDDVLRFPPTLFSTRWYAAFAASEEWMSAAGRSLVVGLATAAVATLVGTAASLALVRGRLPFRRAVELLVISPMIVPPIVIAVGGYGIFADLKLIGSLAGLVAVHTVLAEPFVVLIVSAALYRADVTLEMASASLGASRWMTVRRVTLPLISPAILTGALFAFLTSFDEVVLALFLVGTVAPTLPIKIFSGLTFGVTPIVAAVSTMLVGITLASIVLLGGLRVLQAQRFGVQLGRGADLVTAG